MEAREVLLVDLFELGVTAVAVEILDELRYFSELAGSEVEGGADLALAELLQLPRAHHEEDDAPAEEGGTEEAEAVLDEGEVEEVEAELRAIGVEACELEVLLEVPAAGHRLDPEAQREQDLALHGQDLLQREGPTADAAVLLQFGRLDLLILGGHEERGDAEQLVAFAGDGAAVAELIGDEDGEVERVLVAAEVEVHLDEPAHQHLAHARCDLRPPGHKVLGDVPLVLEGARVQLQLREVGVHLGQRVQPLHREGGLLPLGARPLGVGGQLGQAVGEVDPKHPGGAARVHLPRFPVAAVHVLNLSLTAILIRIPCPQYRSCSQATATIDNNRKAGKGKIGWTNTSKASTGSEHLF